MSRPHTLAVPDILDRVGRVSIDIPSLNLSMWPPFSERGSKAVWPGAISITTWSISTTGRPPTARLLPPSILHRKSRWAGSAAFVTRSEIGRLPAAGRCCQWFAPREVRSSPTPSARSQSRSRQTSAYPRRGGGLRRRRICQGAARQGGDPACCAEHRRSSFGDRRPHPPSSRLCDLRAHPPTRRRGPRLGQNRGRLAQDAASRAAQGRLAIRPRDGRL